jgi:hypothetical protein
MKLKLLKVYNINFESPPLGDLGGFYGLTEDEIKIVRVSKPLPFSKGENF